MGNVAGLRCRRCSGSTMGEEVLKVRTENMRTGFGVRRTALLLTLLGGIGTAVAHAFNGFLVLSDGALESPPGAASARALEVPAAPAIAASSPARNEASAASTPRVAAPPDDRWLRAPLYRHAWHPAPRRFHALSCEFSATGAPRVPSWGRSILRFRRRLMGVPHCNRGATLVIEHLPALCQGRALVPIA
jgi:hypothetical protein